jgi:hypothetical protein
VPDPNNNESQSQTYARSRDYHWFGPGPKRILSLDGGGVRGAITVAFLERIEQLLSEVQRKRLQDTIAAKERAGVADQELADARKALANHTIRLGDWFDLIGGTSTGSLIAGALALGFNTAQIKDFYLDRAAYIFKRPFWRIPGLQAKFDARALQQEIDKIVEKRTLDSEDLITGLCVVTKRMDTGSPWIISNNPLAPYWPAGQGYKANSEYLLATLVRASTAAPHFFDPEILAIADEEAREPLGDVNAQLGRFPRLTRLLTRIRALMIANKSGPSPETHGLFVDGGVTPFNNPSIALLMQVVLKRFQVCWPLGPDDLTLVSIGTGSFRAKLSFTELGFAGPLKLALHSLLSMMTDTQNQALAIMQWLGECPHPWRINSEIGDLAHEQPPGHRWFRFMRYDILLEQDWLKATLNKDLTDEAVLAYRNMDDPGIIQHIYELAVEAAQLQVRIEDFFPDRTAATTPLPRPAQAAGAA